MWPNGLVFPSKSKAELFDDAPNADAFPVPVPWPKAEEKAAAPKLGPG